MMVSRSVLKKGEKMNPKISEKEIEDWFESEEEEQNDQALVTDSLLETKYAESQLSVVRTVMDFTLFHLKQSLENKEYINASPDYQRRHRWDIKKRSQLIESFLMNIPVPSIFLYENDYNQYEIMDGRQRIDTLRTFFNNEFALKGLEYWKEIEGKRYLELPIVIQRGLARRTINAVVLLAETSKGAKPSNDIRKILFKRLNTGGVQLNPQELRNALYPGLFKDLILELSRTKTFTTIWGIPEKTLSEKESPSQELLENNLYQTMADCELVLRFFAIRSLVNETLSGSLKDILDKTMIANKAIEEVAISKYRSLFLDSINGLFAIFCKDTFIVPTTGRLSRPLYDSLMVAFSRLDKNNLSTPQIIKERLNQAASDQKKYDILIGRGNTAEAIKNRVALAEEILLK